MSGLALPASLAQLTRCAGESSRCNLEAVHLTDPGGGQFKVTVSDGRRLIHVQGCCPDSPDGPGELGCPPDVPVLVPRESWDLIFRIAPKLSTHQRWRAGGEKVAPVRIARLSDARLLLSSAERTITTEQSGATYPDWRQIMPATKPAAVVYVNPKLLAELLTTIAAMLPDENQRVALCLWEPAKEDEPTKPMAVVAKNGQNGTCIDAILMPLEPPPPPPEPEEDEKLQPCPTLEETLELYFDSYEDWPFEIVDDDVEEFVNDFSLTVESPPWTRAQIHAAIKAMQTEPPESPAEEETANASSD